jgi:hypothetical protein
MISTNEQQDLHEIVRIFPQGESSHYFTTTNLQIQKSIIMRNQDLRISEE